MLMEAFDSKGIYITSAFVVCDSTLSDPLHHESALVGYLVNKSGKRHRKFITYVDELLQKQKELGFRIVNRGGQHLSLLGDNT